MVEVVLALTALIAVLGAYVTIDRRDVRERTERAALLTRIQDPAKALADEAAKDAGIDLQVTGPPPVSDEAEEWSRLLEQHLEPEA